MGLFDDFSDFTKGLPLTTEGSWGSKRKNKEQVELLTEIIRHTPVGSFLESTIDNIVRDKVNPKRGSILHCSMYGVEHTGIYIGSNQIVDLDGNGNISKKDPKRFINGTNAISIYVACDDTSVLYSNSIADAAEKSIGDKRKYDLLADNCHRFAGYCITKDYDSEKLVETFSGLEKIIKNHFSPKKFTWRVWDLASDQMF